ncbi:NAD(P)/FAD-dependent oxidoreductase [Aureibaculum sp. 2210JD6-5]|uniref:NAD(P)/FAD-dependent oxidoreductase n=1 Tax=Aureibaculum sp. 2210JD6-5 TaxID=3103957 RepID=UPI002AAE7A8B|nr:NAD(P)/FAD-dependent oxidoreductase [Aureibaculum sp. 2210JD6-5]MDY7396832.1 NAD(P)/FAD-dependent oxidoreductase [Aureibaculum sp. 2210JD6-5]
MNKITIIGGGAAGFFAAITCAEKNPAAEIIILERGKEVLQKVKISGGGRCNVTHACFDPKELCEYYPRGKKELLGPFHQFMTGDTMQWFEDSGVALKIEADNRVFPVSNSSQSIIDVLINATEKLGIKVKLNHRVENFEKVGGLWKINTNKGDFIADKLLIASGSNTKIWEMLNNLDHTIVPPVPSLFTFKINDKRIREIPGISVPNATVSIANSTFETSGPLLITHWGMSGPAVLKLSAFGARFLAKKDYHYNVVINWLSKQTEQIFEKLKTIRTAHKKKQVILKSVFQEIPKRLWENLVLASEIKNESRWADVSNKQLENLSNQLTKGIFNANGKSTFKEEFVTAGGIDLKEVNFKRFESKLHKNLFFAGEVLNIDAVTGGFNFQNAWTGGYIAGNVMAE